MPLFGRPGEGVLTALLGLPRRPENLRENASSECIPAFFSGASGLVRCLLDATEHQDRGCGGVDAKMHTIGTDRRPKNFAFEDAEGGGVARLRLQSCQVAGPGRLLGGSWTSNKCSNGSSGPSRPVRVRSAPPDEGPTGPPDHPGPHCKRLHVFLQVLKNPAGTEAPSHQGPSAEKRRLHTCAHERTDAPNGS